LRRHVEKSFGWRGSGTVHQHIDAPCVAQALGDHHLRPLRRGEIHAERERGAARASAGSRGGGGTFAVDVGHRHCPATGGNLQAHCGAQPLGASRDCCYLGCHLYVVLLSSDCRSCPVAQQAHRSARQQ
jgi:hypothetical protein